MKEKDTRPKGIQKGAPSGFVISLVFHVAIFFLAGLFVVFTVVNKQEPEFEPPPPIERPKMKLKKPKVKVKKSSQPKPSSRIVAKVKTKQMPEIQLPDLVGTGDGLLGGLGGDDGSDFDVPDINSVKLLGGRKSIGNDLVGVYYDFNRRSDGVGKGIDPASYQEIILDFMDHDWDTRRIAKYYRSPEKRYATCIMVPEIPSDLGPEAFGEPGAAGYCWAVLYKGTLVHKEEITFRFWGFGDDVLVVRVDGEVVLNGSWPTGQVYQRGGWRSRSPQSRTFRLGANKSDVGDWITLEPNEPKELEVLIGESPGGRFTAMLLVEEEGVDYELNKQGGPILPMFTMAPPTWEMKDAIYEHLVIGEAMLTNGPVFKDY